MCEGNECDTGKFLITHYPNLEKSFLQELNQEIGLLKQINGGNADLFVRLKAGIPQWIDTTRRKLFRLDKKHS